MNRLSSHPRVSWLPHAGGRSGKPPADIDALVDCIVRCSWFAHDHGRCIGELDVNPLTVMERGGRVVDALLVRDGARPE
ncbi:MAG: acetate--CoA ligase family protein [Betaproteobacteria bacterium]|nr:acetate--CoA ligase family protein [Betaproteobacteria bacterium]